MGIAQKVSREFADGVRSRGRSYFDKGKVTITSAKAGEIVVAKVRGTVPYRVKLRRAAAGCTPRVRACTSARRGNPASTSGRRSSRPMPGNS